MNARVACACALDMSDRQEEKGTRKETFCIYKLGRVLTLIFAFAICYAYCQVYGARCTARALLREATVFNFSLSPRLCYQSQRTKGFSS